MKTRYSTPVLSLLLFAASLCAVPLYAYAQSGTYFDPIHVQIEPDIFDSYIQQTKTQWQVDSLNQSLQNIQGAINDQTQQQTQLQQQQLYQQKAAQCPPNAQPYVSKITGKLGNCYCIPPYSMVNGVCLMPSEIPSAADQARAKQDAACKASFGPTARASGAQGCDLGIPASLPSTPPVATKTNDQRCKDSFGAYSYWNGQTNEKGPFCSCSTGYQWTTDMKSCVAIQPTTGIVAERDGSESNSRKAPQTNNQRCQEFYGSHSSWDGTLNSAGGPVCECEAGYQLVLDECTQMPTFMRQPTANPQTADKADSPSNIGEATTPTESKPSTMPQRRGFWSWLLGVFGL